MDFSWAVTEKSHSPPPKHAEVFRGYFTDIRRAARKSLPKKPSKELCNLLGLKRVPADLEKGVSFLTVPVNDTQSQEPVAGPPGSLEPDIAAPKQSIFDKTLSVLPCSESLESCSKRERTIVALTIYLALVILLLLVIVVILSVTLSSQSNNDESGNSGVRVPSSDILVTSTAVPIPASKSSTFTASTVAASSSARTESSSSSGSGLSSTASTSYRPTSRRASPRPPTTVSSKSSTSSTGSSPTAYSESPGPTRTRQTLTPSTKSSTRVSYTTSTTPTMSSSTSGNTSSHSSSVTSSSRPPSSSEKPLTTESVSSNSSLLSTTSSTFITRSSSTEAISSSKVSSPTTLNPVFFPKLAAQTVPATCSSRDCQNARDTVRKIDFNTSPCLDFYQFACGGWIASKLNSLSIDPGGPETVQEELRQTLLVQVKDLLSASSSPFDSFAEKVSKRLYQSCIESNENQDETLALAELHQAVDVLGMTPAGNIVNTVPNLLSRVNRLFGVTPFFRTEVHPLSTGDGYSVYGLKVSPPTLNLESTIYRLPLDYNEIASEYVDAVAAILYTYISSFTFEEFESRKKRSSRKRRQTSLGDQANYTQIYERVVRAYYLEANISKIIDDVLGDGVQTEEVDETTVLRLVDSDINIPWDFALGISDPKVTVVLVYPDYFRKLDELLGKTSDDDVMMYIFMSLMTQRIWKYLPLGLRQSARLSGGDVFPPYTDVDCVENALQLAKEEIHGIYIGKLTQKVLDNRIQLTNLDDLINLSFQDLVSTTPWMQAGLKRVVSILMTNMRVQFSTVSYEIRSSSGITGENQTFLSLAMELHGQMYDIKMGKLRSNATVENSLDWTSTSVIYDGESNILGLPTALGVYFVNGNEPLFDKHGRIGKLMADQMIKVLTGELKRGVAPAWWGPDNIRSFNDVDSCFSDQQSDLQLSNYESGNMMLANGGLQLIKEAYLSSSTTLNDVIQGTTLTQEMLFYLNAAQLHCSVDEASLDHQLLRQRINNMMMNQGNFENLYSCPVGSPLVTPKKCTLL